MKSLNMALVGDASIATALGKFSSKTDITLYDNKSADSILTFYVASAYPEKIQALIQILAIADFPILNISKIDKYLGEQIVAIDSFRFDVGLILHPPEISAENLKTLVKGTTLERFIIVDSVEGLKAEIAKLSGKVAKAAQTKVVIDQAFNVKGVGTVVLGAVKEGEVKVHDALELLPSQKEVGIKSIQMHDEDVQEAPVGSRVGLSIKGATADEIGRGDVLATKGSMIVSKELSIKFEKSKFYKGEVKAEGQYHLAVGAEIIPVKIAIEGSTLKVSAQKPFALSKKERCILLDMNAQGLRIVGSGDII